MTTTQSVREPRLACRPAGRPSTTGSAVLWVGTVAYGASTVALLAVLSRHVVPGRVHFHRRPARPRLRRLPGPRRDHAAQRVAGGGRAPTAGATPPFGAAHHGGVTRRSAGPRLPAPRRGPRRGHRHHSDGRLASPSPCARARCWAAIGSRRWGSTSSSKGIARFVARRDRRHRSSASRASRSGCAPGPPSRSWPCPSGAATSASRIGPAPRSPRPPPRSPSWVCSSNSTSSSRRRCWPATGATSYDLAAVPSKGVYLALLAIGPLIFPSVRGRPDRRLVLGAASVALAFGAACAGALVLGRHLIADVLGRPPADPLEMGTPRAGHGPRRRHRHRHQRRHRARGAASVAPARGGDRRHGGGLATPAGAADSSPSSFWGARPSPWSCPWPTA